MSRCSGCGGACTCSVTAPDGSIAVTPTQAGQGYQVATVVAPDQAAGAGGHNLIRKVPAGGLFLGVEDVGGVGGGGSGTGSTTLIAPDASSGFETANVSGLKVIMDGWANQVARNVNPRIVTLADNTKALQLPQVIPAVAGRPSVANAGLGTSSNWHGQLPRTGATTPLVSDSLGGNIVVVPSGQSRLVGVVLSIEFGQISPSPETVAYAAKIAAWSAEWSVNMVIGPAVVTFGFYSIRFEPQPMSRNMQQATLTGWAQVPGGNHSPRLTFGLNNDSLPSSPSIQVGIASWSALMLYA